MILPTGPMWSAAPTRRSKSNCIALLDRRIFEIAQYMARPYRRCMDSGTGNVDNEKNIQAGK